MRAALALGRHGMGLTAPNPSVAALVVKNGIVLGRGVTAAGGRPHAEPVALAEAGEVARGSTVYVTLEPCSHQGHTPPCVAAIIAAGVSCVVVALGDPDPRVAGRGIAHLRAAGLQVIENTAFEEARRDHRGHCRRVTAGRPLVTVKMAETADGFAAGAPDVARLLITGPIANGRVQMLRAMHDAILVGIGTAVQDDPLLTVRLAGLERHRPIRVVLDSASRLNVGSRLVQTARAIPLLVCVSPDASQDRVTSLNDHGVEVCRVPYRPDGRLDVGEVLRALADRGITRVLCEGGPRLGSVLVEDGWADDVVIFTSPDTLGAPGLQSLTDIARARIANPDDFRIRDDFMAGRDRLRMFERQDSTCSRD